MFRMILYMVMTVVVITVLRSILGIITKGFADLFKGEASVAGPRPSRSDVPLSGELKRDPVCGTYVSAATPIKKISGSQTLYFCSEDCRAKHKG